MASVNSIGSVLSATEEQFIQLHQQPRHQSLELQTFLKMFNEKQKIAQEDAAVLKALNVTHKQVGEKLSRVVEKAVSVYQLQIEETPINPFSPNYERPVLEIDDEGTFKVSGFHLRQMGSDYCLFCDHQIRYPFKFEVVNAATNEKARFPELTLHFIKAHDYFAIPGEYRIDPALICRILMLSDKNS
jgi:hypothetical protein